MNKSISVFCKVCSTHVSTELYGFQHTLLAQLLAGILKISDSRIYNIFLLRFYVQGEVTFNWDDHKLNVG